MKVRMKVRHRQYMPGDITEDLSEGVAMTMIQHNRAEAVSDEDLTAETVKALDKPRMDRAMKRAKVNRK